MKKYSGKGVYGAIAIGKISVLKKNDAAVTRVHVEDAAAERRVSKRQSRRLRSSFRLFTTRRSKRSARQTRRSSRYT